MVKSTKPIFRSLVLSVLLLQICFAQLEPTIVQVSSTLSQYTKPQGSLSGGMKLYIQGSNFNTDPSTIQVTIGSYPCTIAAEGLTSNSLSCITTPATNPNSTWNLPVTITCQNQVPVLCTANVCQVSYAPSMTPMLQEFSPKTVSGSDKLAIWGIHRITDLGDGRSPGIGQINSLLINSLTCSIIDVIQNEDLNPTYRDAIYCNPYLKQEAGEYNFEANYAIGNAPTSVRAKQTSYLTKKDYTLRVAAEVSTDAAAVTFLHQGGINGQRLTVSMYGLSTNLQNYGCRVAGQDCSVISASNTLNQITIEIPKYDSSTNALKGQLPQDPSDTSSQSSPFIGGNGLRYTRYSNDQQQWKSLEVWLAALRAGTMTLAIAEDKIVSELSTTQVYGSYYIEFVRGYLYIPMAGEYTFFGLADDQFMFTMSQYQNNSNALNMQTLIYHNTYINDHFDPFVSKTTNVTATRTFTQPGYYYIEVVTINWGGAGYYKIMMQTPNLFNAQQPVNPTWQIDYFGIQQSTVQPEIITITVNKASLTAALGKFQLVYYINTAGVLVPVTSDNINVGDSASTFYTKLASLWPLYNYYPAVTLTLLNSSKQVTTDLTKVAFYQYTITVVRYRLTSSFGNLYSSDASSVSIASSQGHSAPLSGTYTMTINNKPVALWNGTFFSTVNIPSNTPDYMLTDAINNIYGTKQIEVRMLMDSSFDDEIKFVILYYGILQQPYDIHVGVANLKGGKSNTFNINYTITRPFSNLPYYDPIPYQFLRVPSNTPALMLTVNQIPVLCQDCSYDFKTTLTTSLTTATLNANLLTLTLTDPANVGFLLSDVSVSLFGEICIIQNGGTLSSFTCKFQTNLDGSAVLPANVGKPIVHVTQIGYADLSSISDITISASITSFSPQNSGPFGGLSATIIGKHFPVSSDKAKNLEIYLCETKVSSISTISNELIAFLIPPQSGTCNSTNSYLSINSVQYPLTFSYDASQTPLISSLSLTSASPILKGQITITGTNFGTLAQTNVYLYDVNGTQQYELTILTLTSTTITCILGGGKTGLYNVRIFDTSQGLSAPNAASTFNYEILVSSVSPTSGSLGGGYQLTINGLNFASKDSTNVFIGSALNSMCKITSMTTTQINCTMPTMDDSYTAGTAYDVVVTGRAIEESICNGLCSFTFDSAVTNTVNPLINSTFNAGDLITVSGSGLTNAVVSVGGVTVSLATTNDSSLSFKYPALTAGLYPIMIMTATGYAYPLLQTVTTLWLINGISRSSGSYMGHVLTVAGNGMSTNVQDPTCKVWMICPVGGKIQLNRISAAANVLKFQTVPTIGSADQYCVINITQGLTFRQYGYSYSSYLTANITASLNASSPNTYILTKTWLTSTTINLVTVQYLDSQNNPTSSIYPMTITNINSTSYSITPTGGYLPAGTFRIRASSVFEGFARMTPPTFTIAFPSTPTATNAMVSYLGGAQYLINGAGFQTINPQNNQITICGLKAQVISATTTQATLIIPPLVTSTTQNAFNLAKLSMVSGIPFGDTASTATLVADSNSNTVYSSNSNTTCYVGLDFGLNAAVNINAIKYMPNSIWPIVSVKLIGATFQASNDNITWSKIFEVDGSVHTGWNYWLNANSNSLQYRYVRMLHNSSSFCQLAELQVEGMIYSTFNVDPTSDKGCNAVIQLPNNVNVNVTNGNVNYMAAKTSTVTSVSPQFGPSTGSTLVTINGNNFGSTVTVTIDGVSCVIVSNNASVISCTSGLRSKPPANGNTFIVTSDSNPSILSSPPYLYIDRWSSQATWGGEALPRAGDSVYVPPGMTLLVDVASTPVLFSVIVEGGKIIFADEIDMSFDAHYFAVIGGEFRAGTETSPYQHQLTFTLYGDYYDKQLPTLGNKMIACRNCKFNMHGIPRTPTWTELCTTVLPGDNVVHLCQPVDWRIGESIVVAATSFNHFESEEMVIASVSADNKSLTLTKSFVFRHISETETYGGQDFVMRAEVGLLTRNIKMRGDPTSENRPYGSHLMLTGSVAKGLDAKLSYSQFSYCGQPMIIGRYCTHFHMAGEVPNSFVRGISVHHSYARLLTIHGTHYLTVELNVGYSIKGHAIFIEDGIETKNIIQDNLVVSSITSFTMLQSDITVASYWITNPFNTVVRNHAAGGDFYGFWYQIKDNPDGPSATFDICPTGMRLGLSRDNVAHSNIRFGLRIFQLSSREIPCKLTQDESLLDPYSGNKAYESVFENYTLWKNKECGFLGQQLGFTTIKNFRTIDSVKGGMQFHKTNYTKQLVVATDSVIVGFSKTNAPTNIDTDYANARGVIASRTDGLLIQNIQFFNYGPTMTPLQSCSQCKDFRVWVTGGKTTYFKNISYTNITGNYIYWQKWRRQIFMDLDGTLLDPARQLLSLPAQTSGSISPYRPSLMVPNHCYHIAGSIWNESVYCDQNITMRGILFTNALPDINFQAIDIKAKLLTDPYENFTSQSLNDSDFSDQYMIVIKKHSMDIKHSWAMPFASGYMYNIHWKWGIDFTHMAIAPSRLWTAADGVVLRFNYTDNRELYQIGKWYQQQLQLPYVQKSLTMLNVNTCQNGDYYHNNTLRYVWICVSGRNKTIREWIDVNGIRCLNFCPTTPLEPDQETTPRYWSNASNWNNSVLPAAGENVTIPKQWYMIKDIDTPIFNYVQIRGTLSFDQTRDHLFQAHYIWVKGKWVIGTQSTPYVMNTTIVLHGEKDDLYLVLDNDASGNKMLAATGGLEFYGTVTTNVWNRLTAIAPVGATTINVQDTSGWKVGNHLVIGASYAGRNQSEEIVITAINSNTITFTPPLAFQHYGDSNVTISNAYGILDTRAGVGLLSRNIQITKGPDANGWGCRVLIYSYLELSTNFLIPPTPKNGYAIFDGVQLNGCGQYDTDYAGLRIQKLGSVIKTTNVTSITRSSIHGCNGFCTYIDQINNVTFSNNVFYFAKKFIVLVIVAKNFNFTNNFMTKAIKRPELAKALATTLLPDDTACFEQYTAIDLLNGRVNVSNNLAQGSEGQGFVFPYTSCDLISTYSFYNNTAGSCEIAFMLNGVKDMTCLAAGYMIGYASFIGLMANPPFFQTKIIYQRMFFTDNGRGITLRFGHDTDDNTIIVQNSYFAGYSRPNCVSCYSDKTTSYCNGGYAVRMFSATLAGQGFPLAKLQTIFDVICNAEAFDMKSYFKNVLFENYQYNGASVPYCKKMAVFKRHDLASDAVGSAYLTNTTCKNCQKQAWGYFDAPNPAWFGWFGGCGQLDCTGPNNYLIHDQDGSFFGTPSQLLANNSMIGNFENNCSFIPQTNGYYCTFEDLAVMQYESIAPDFNKRIMWPVYLRYDGGSWNSTTNAWREWEWNGPEPMNLRIARFWSTVRLYQSYNLTYSSQPPSDSKFQLQKRLQPGGNAKDWVIIRIYYPLPNSLEVRVKNDTGTDILIKPYPIVSGVPTDLRTKVNICGANNFHYNNGTIEFVLNGLNNCQVRVSLSSYIQISARLTVSVADFYTNNGPTTFLTNICAFLGIDTGRLKIVGIASGSAIVSAYLTDPVSAIGVAQTTPTNISGSNQNLQNIASSLNTAVSSSQIYLGAPVISFDTQVVVFNTDGTIYTAPTEQSSTSNTLMIILLSTIIPVAVIIVIVTVFIYCRRKREKIFHQSLEGQTSDVNTDEKPKEFEIIQDKKLATFEVAVEEYD